MKNQTKTLILTTLILFSFSACSSESTETPRPSAPTVTQEKNATSSSTTPPSDLAKADEKTATLSTEISASDQILLSGAISNLDPSLCDKLENSNLKTSCKDQVAANGILKQAQETGNYNLCDQIQLPETKSTCQALKAVAESEAKKIEEYQTKLTTDQQKASEFIKSNDLKSCQTLNFPGLIQDCELAILKSEFQNSKDEKICDKASNEGIKELCLMDISRL